MSRKIAVYSFLVTCLLLAVLLLTKVITPLLSGIIFAVALVVFGITSRGFRN